MWEESGRGCLSSSDGRLSVSQTCPPRSSLTGVYLINCSYNYQSSGHQHYSAALGPHLRLCSLTQLLAVLQRRRRQTCDPAGVTPEVLLLRCCRNMPHLHRRISATWAEVEEEGKRDVNLQREMSDENKLKTVQCESRGGRVIEEEAEKTHPCWGVRGNILGDKFGEVFTFHIRYAIQDFLCCITFQKPPGCQQRPHR